MSICQNNTPRYTDSTCCNCGPGHTDTCCCGCPGGDDCECTGGCICWRNCFNHDDSPEPKEEQG